MRLTFSGGFYVHHSSCTADLDVAGRVADVALQPVVGILPERRIGAGRGNRPGSAAGWPAVNVLRLRCLLVTESVACPNGGNRFYPTICFSNLTFGSK